jgi:hypothetical protein
MFKLRWRMTSPNTGAESVPTLVSTSPPYSDRDITQDDHDGVKQHNNTSIMVSVQKTSACFTSRRIIQLNWFTKLFIYCDFVCCNNYRASPIALYTCLNMNFFQSNFLYICLDFLLTVVHVCTKTVVHLVTIFCIL